MRFNNRHFDGKDFKLFQERFFPVTLELVFTSLPIFNDNIENNFSHSTFSIYNANSLVLIETCISYFMRIRLLNSLETLFIMSKKVVN